MGEHTTESAIDTEQPSVARIYDYLLGGAHNFEADRKLGDQMIAATPNAPLIARSNRDTLRRFVRYLIDQGIDQFLDIGSGIPTVGNVHEIAQSHNPDARVVYVELDPFAVAYARQILHGNLNVSAVQGDVRDIDTLLSQPELHQQLDLSRPVGVLMVAMLNYVPDAAVVDQIMDRIIATIPSGSYVAITYAVSDAQSAGIEDIRKLTSRTTTQAVTRPKAEVAEMMRGLDVVEPGLVPTRSWRPDDEDMVQGPDEPPELLAMYAVVGRKP